MTPLATPTGRGMAAAHDRAEVRATPLADVPEAGRRDLDATVTADVREQTP